MAKLDVQMTCQFGDMWFNRGGLVQSPIVWHSAAPDWNDESGTGITGRYVHPRKEVYQAPVPKRQDTFISGTGGRTGRAFSVVSGTWKDDTAFPREDNYILAMVDGNSTAVCEVKSATTTSNIEHAMLRFDRDDPAVANSSNKGVGNNYWYFQVAYGQMVDYRIWCDWHAPFRMDYTNNGGVTWKNGVAVSSGLGDVQQYLTSNRHSVEFLLQPDYDNDIMIVQIGAFNYLRNVPLDASNKPTALPTIGNIRVVTKGSSMRFGYYPLRYPTPISIPKSAKKLTGEVVQQTDQAVITVNGRTVSPADQTVSASVSTADGVAFTANIQAARPDSGDTQGANAPARLSDFTIYIPPVWGNAADGVPDGRVGNLDLMYVRSISVCDDIAQTISYAGELQVNNWRGAYNGSYGRYAALLDLSNGYQFYRQCAGIIGGRNGIHLLRQDPARLGWVPISDCSEQCMIPLNQEVDFDGWPWNAAIWFLAQCAGVHPVWLQYIPYWPPGVATSDCPYWTLKRGSGARPASLHYRQEIIWSIMQEITQQLVGIDPMTGLSIPYYLGFDVNGCLHCEPISFASMPSSGFYSTMPWLTGGVPIEKLEVFTSVAEMRSSIDLFGIDPQSNELLYLHQGADPRVRKIMGYNVPLTQQSPTFVSDGYMAYVGNCYQFQTSLPVQTLRIHAPMIPSTMAAQVITVWAQEIGGFGQYKTDTVATACGWNGAERDCLHIIEARNLLNAL